MSISFGGIGELSVTFEADSGVKTGWPVKIGGSGKVYACEEGERFCGIAAGVSEDGYATVQIRGFVKCKYTGTAPALGFEHLVADGSGGVKKDAGKTNSFTDASSQSVSLTRYTGGEYMTAELDTTGKTVGIYM